MFREAYYGPVILSQLVLKMKVNLAWSSAHNLPKVADVFINMWDPSTEGGQWGVNTQGVTKVRKPRILDRGPSKGLEMWLNWWVAFV